MTIRLLVQVGHNKILQKVKSLVVSIGANPTFKVELVPMEYIPTIPPLSLTMSVCHQLFYRGRSFYAKSTTKILMM